MSTSDQWFTVPSQLTAVNEEIWQRLLTAPGDRDSGWRLPVLATGGLHAEVRQRIVVLRSVDARQRILFAHTDVRSAKIGHLQSHSKTTWLFYDASQQVQLQLTGHATIHTNDELADRFWSEETEVSLRGYLGAQPPGTLCESADTNLPDDVRNRIPKRSELQSGRQNFAVISCVVESAEWLLLRQDGNLRATFEYDGNVARSNWVAP